MKILFYRYGSICEPDIIDALTEIGHTVTEMTEEITNKNFVLGDCARAVSQSLLNHPQDCVFTVNFFPIISDVCNIFHIPYISWIVDSPIMELWSKSIQNPWNRIFIFDREQYREIAPFNPDCVFHFPLAVNITGKQQVIQNASASMRAKYTSDCSFVGSLYTEKCPYDNLSNPPDYLRGYLNGLIEAQIKVYGYYFIDKILPDNVVEDFKAHLPQFYQYPLDTFLKDRTIVSQFYIGNKISSVERIRTMKALSEHFSLDLYTRSDTSTLPYVHNRGFARTLTEMPIIFHESKINLNPTSKPIRSGIPLRVFDIMGCGGFVLSNYQPELCELFEPGVDFDYYGSLEELLEKTNYYLNHEKERAEIAHNGFVKAAENFNYPKRLHELLSIAFH